MAILIRVCVHCGQSPWQLPLQRAFRYDSIFWVSDMSTAVVNAGTDTRPWPELPLWRPNVARGRAFGSSADDYKKTIEIISFI
jgi:hypothetical protein